MGDHTGWAFWSGKLRDGAGDDLGLQIPGNQHQPFDRGLFLLIFSLKVLQNLSMLSLLRLRNSVKITAESKYTYFIATKLALLGAKQ